MTLATEHDAIPNVVQLLARGNYEIQDDAGNRLCLFNGKALFDPENDASDAGTVAFHAQEADDLVAAAAVSGAPWSTTGLKALVPKINTPESTGIALTAARELTATVAEEALLTGTLYVVYVR